MNAYVKKIGLFDKNEQEHSIVFTRGVNVITGRSATGKSAIIEIFDYCMGNNHFVIPEGVITENSLIYFVLMEVEGNYLLLARKNDRNNSSAFYKNLSPQELDSFEYNIFQDEYFCSLSSFKIKMLSVFGLHIDNSVEKKYRQKNPPSPSIRSFMSFILQHQGLIANKHALFYRFDEKEKKEQVINHFKIFLGIVTQDYLNLKKEIEVKEKEYKYKQIENEDLNDNIEKNKESYQDKLDEFSNISGIPIMESNLSLDIPEKSLEYLSNLNICLGNMNEEKIYKQRDFLIARKGEEESHLLKLESTLRKIINAKEGNDSLYSSFDKLEIPENVELVQSECPFCHSIKNEISIEANQLEESINWLNNELKLSTISTFHFEQDKNKLKKEKEDVKSKIQELNNKIFELDSTISDLTEKKNRYETSVRLKMHIELILNSICILSRKISNTEKLKEQISNLKKELKKFDYEKSLKEVITVINGEILKLSEKFPFERKYSVSFDIENFELTFGEEDKKFQLRSLGSGANWLNAHIVLFLSLLKCFCKMKEKSCIPPILFLDQPSQVYFPPILDNQSKFNPKSIHQKNDTSKLDDDLNAVTNIFSELVNFCMETKEETGLEPQIIVSDHADNLNLITSNGIEFNSIVRKRWREKGEGLISLNE